MSRELFQEFAALSQKAILTDQERRRFSFLTKTLPSGTVNPTQKFDDTEERSRARETKAMADFRSYVSGKMSDAEYRVTTNEYWGRPTTESYVGGNLLGTSTTSGIAGGYTVPAEFFRQTMNAVAAVSPLLDPTVVSLDASNDYVLRGKVYPGWDLSTYKAVRVGDSTQTSPNDNAAPPAYAKFLSGYIYKTSLAVALELEQDADDIVGALTEAYGEGFARGVGVDLINGTGVSQPQGLLTGANNVQLSNTLSYDWLYDLFFSVNARYRQSAKCAWVMPDSALNAIRRFTSNTGLPLIKLTDDGMTLLGKRVIVSPDIPDNTNTSPAQSASIIFGDLSHYRVRCTNLSVIRSLQSGLPNGLGDVTRGECLLNGRMRVDAVVHDASGGATPPIVYSTYTQVRYAPGLGVGPRPSPTKAGC